MLYINFVTLAEKFANTWQQWFTLDPSSLLMYLNNLYMYTSRIFGSNNLQSPRCVRPYRALPCCSYPRCARNIRRARGKKKGDGKGGKITRDKGKREMRTRDGGEDRKEGWKWQQCNGTHGACGSPPGNSGPRFWEEMRIFKQWRQLRHLRQWQSPHPTADLPHC
jgi:hypothetical protein